MEIIRYLIPFYIALMSILGFVSMGVDKYKAIKHKWRISEMTLILIALLGGGIGSFLGMQIFRHKTKHRKFARILPFAAMIYSLLFLWGLYIF